MLGPEHRDRENGQSTKGQREQTKGIGEPGEIRINDTLFRL